MERGIHTLQQLKVEALAIFVVAARALHLESLSPVAAAEVAAPVSLETAALPMVTMRHPPHKTV